MTKPESIRGRCSCGKVRYEARAKPLNTMVCHCQTCRRVAASPVVAWVTFDKTSFRLTKGKPKAFKSSRKVRRTFCGACGTPLTYQTTQYPDTIDVTTCSLDDPGAFPPTHHSWLSHDVKWVKFGDGLPAFQEFRPS